MKTNSIYTLVIFAIAILSSCTSPMEPEDLNGYWEIESVTLQDGSKKSFTVNPVVDFIELENKNGTRTKVKPQFDGTFVSNGATEKFTIEASNALILTYTTPYDTWEETVLSLSENKMTVKNKDKKIYTYKRFIPFSQKNK
ncbi:hypothetical protein SCB49_14365 [unidentified eubacterium SCB49]|nr:hypothetical protein SCB49_14365 [unidentified eubacterium SCB49]